jgi:hypothetical protein
MTKQHALYRSISRAIDAYGDRHHITAREYFAPLLGYRGPTAAVQFSSALNPNSDNPLSIDRYDAILREIDERGRAELLSTLAKQHGYRLCPGSEPMEPSERDIVSMILGLDQSHGRLAKEIREAIEDGEIDSTEARRITMRIATFVDVLRDLEFWVRGGEQ